MWQVRQFLRGLCKTLASHNSTQKVVLCSKTSNSANLKTCRLKHLQRVHSLYLHTLKSSSRRVIWRYRASTPVFYLQHHWGYWSVYCLCVLIEFTAASLGNTAEKDCHSDIWPQIYDILPPCICLFSCNHDFFTLTDDFWHCNSPSTTKINKTKASITAPLMAVIFLLKIKKKKWILSVNLRSRIQAKPPYKPKPESWHFHYFPHNLARLFQLNSVSARAPFSFDDIAPPSHVGFQIAVAAEQVTRGAQHYLQVYSEMFFDVSQPPLCPLITVVSRHISRHPSPRLYCGSL